MENTSFDKYKKKGIRVWAKGNIDLTILLMTLILVGFGLVMVFSASYYESDMDYSDPMYFATRQGTWMLIGFVTGGVLTFIDVNNLRKTAWIFYGLSVIALLVVLVAGKSTHGAQRWLVIGPIQFQPSDFAKLATVLCLANFMATPGGNVRTLKGFIGCCVIIGIPAGLIGVENASTAAIVAIVGVLMICMAGARWSYMLTMGGLGAAGFFGILTAKGYRMTRIEAWLHPEQYMDNESYQTMQSLYAIASGGLFGVGFDNSRQKLGYIPESHNDIIFAIICEELGFFGAFLLVVVFGILIWRGFVAAFNAPSAFTTYTAIGITCMIGVQVVLNIAVATNTIPNTGVALPFISYGGTSLLVMLASIGILLNISRLFNTDDI